MARPSGLAAGLAIGATTIYMALAVFARGGWSAFVSEPALVALLACTVVLAAASLFTRGNLDRGIREDRGNRWVIGAIGLIGLALAVVPPWTDRLDLATVGGEGLRWIGVLLFAIGGWLRIWPVYVLGRRFSGLVAIQPGHELVTTGIYRLIRHPSYLGLLVNSCGWALAFRSGMGLVLVGLTLVPLVARIRSEERLLEEQFGAEYARYRARTARLVPGLY
jgi:protein-S-isoprenylcysteine O-methyltransferase Ste14